MPLLLIACSASKLRAPEPVAAKKLYRGSLFVGALNLASERGYTPLILSAKHGFIEPDQKIAYYDEKLQTQYDGPWPHGDGFYVGGELYFGKAPARFAPLLPRCQQGEMVSALYKLIQAAPADRPNKGVVVTLVAALLQRPHTKQELRDLLDREFPNGNPKMHNTIDIQLNQCRIGDERGFKLMRSPETRNKSYWLVPKADA